MSHMKSAKYSFQHTPEPIGFGTMFSKRFQFIASSSSMPQQTVSANQHPQTQSPFFTRLPAELRNKVYTHVFACNDSSIAPTESSGWQSKPPHPLSLLLACRRIHHEAGILAFNTHTFAIGVSIQPTYLGLTSAISPLSTMQLESIQSVSVLASANGGALLSNALLTLPNLHRFAIKAARRTSHAQARQPPSDLQWHTHPHAIYSSLGWRAHTDLSLEAIDKYAPHWFVQTIRCVTRGKAYAWQNGAKWTAQWPQLDSALCYSRIQSEGDGVREDLFMDLDAVGVVPGVQVCACGCEEVSWTAAVLMQEGGRTVEIDLQYCGHVEPLEPEPKYEPEVLLVPGTTPARQAVISNAGIGYEADEEYWEAIRRRNGNLGALCRGLWRRVAQPLQSQETLINAEIIGRVKGDGDERFSST